MNNWFAARRQRMLRLKVRREGERPFTPRLSAAAPVFEQCPRCKAAVTRANEKLGDGRLTLSEQTRPIKGGLILSDGDVEVNCTFETLVRLQRGEMDREVAKVLFD